MKSILLPLLAAFSWPTATIAGIDSAVQNPCKNLLGYVRCVKQSKILIRKKYKS